MATGNVSGLMGVHTKEIFWIISSMVMASCDRLVARFMKDSGRMETRMGKVNILTLSTVNTKDSGKITCTMVTESFLIWMGLFTKEFLLKESSTAMVSVL